LHVLARSRRLPRLHERDGEARVVTLGVKHAVDVSGRVVILWQKAEKGRLK
jgi:hypothetical protein